jgi:hypothetical protein
VARDEQGDAAPGPHEKDHRSSIARTRTQFHHSLAICEAATRFPAAANEMPRPCPKRLPVSTAQQAREICCHIVEMSESLELFCRISIHHSKSVT